MADEDRDAKIAKFQSFTDEYDIQKTISSLEAANWDVELAVSSFFENSDEPIVSDLQTQLSMYI